jgi:hypothetical protein
MGRDHKFPNPHDCRPNDQAVLCPAERVLALYNQDSGDTAEKIAKKVRQWFIGKARSNGWAGVRFLKDVQSSHGSGCLLWIPPRVINVTVEVTQNILILSPQEE